LGLSQRVEYESHSVIQMGMMVRGVRNLSHDPGTFRCETKREAKNMVSWRM
jgi:hypothetical protein